MFCTKCGARNEDEAKFCAKCGNSLFKNIVNDSQHKNNMSSNYNQKNNINSSKPDTLDKVSQAVDNISDNVTNSFNKHKQIIVDENNFRYENSGLSLFTLSNNIDTSNVQRQAYNNQYSQLGGFLAFIFYGSLVSMALVCLGVVVNMLFSGAGLFKIIFSQYWSSITPQLIINWILQLAFMATSFTLTFKFLMKIKHKDIDFLHFYHKMCIFIAILFVAYVALIILVTVVFNSSYYFNPYYFSSLGNLIASFVGTIIGTLFSIVISALLFTLYFAKSVRVRTYMGTDMYLRLSYFTRNVKSPQPATFQIVNMQSNNQTQQPNSNFNNNTNANQNVDGDWTEKKEKVSGSVYCKNCGTKIIEGNVFCTKCGSRVV